MLTRTGETGFAGLDLFFLAVILFVTTPSLLAQDRQLEKKSIQQPLCKMQVAGKAVELKANSGGYFQRISGIKPGSVMPVELSYPSGKPGESIVLAVLDGGRINGDKVVEVVKLDGEGKCRFELHLSGNTGLFRVLASKGMDEKVVQVWVGSEGHSAKE